MPAASIRVMNVMMNVGVPACSLQLPAIEAVAGMLACFSAEASRLLAWPRLLLSLSYPAKALRNDSTSLSALERGSLSRLFSWAISYLQQARWIGLRKQGGHACSRGRRSLPRGPLAADRCAHELLVLRLALLHLRHILLQCAAWSHRVRRGHPPAAALCTYG